MEPLHVTQALPGLLLVIFALPRLVSGMVTARLLESFGAAVLAVIVLTASSSLIAENLDQRQVRFGAAEQVGPLTPDSSGQFARIAATEIRRLTDQPVLFISYPAPSAYAEGALTNPTRYDYPLASAFPSAAQDEVIGQIRAGSIRWVCISGDLAGGADPLAPTELIPWVQSNMALVQQLPSSALYRRG
mgnify:CR=1 FL=1